MKFAINKNIHMLRFDPNSELSIWQQLGLEPKIKDQALPKIKKDKEMQKLCNTYGVQYEPPANGETQAQRVLRLTRINRKVKRKQQKLEKSNIKVSDIPDLTGNQQFDNALKFIREFEHEQMQYTLNICCICQEQRICQKKYNNDTCPRCFRDKNDVKLFSNENHMNPKDIPKELENLTVAEQQIISRIIPCINIHLLKHGALLPMDIV